jgi:hypothetical protein
VTNDGVWLYDNVPESKEQSPNLNWLGWGQTGTVDRSMAPKFKTINRYVYVQVLLHLHDAVHYKQPPKWESGKWKIHHDSSTAHSSQNMWRLLAKHNIPQARQLPVHDKSSM